MILKLFLVVLTFILAAYGEFLLIFVPLFYATMGFAAVACEVQSI